MTTDAALASRVLVVKDLDLKSKGHGFELWCSASIYFKGVLLFIFNNDNDNRNSQYMTK